MRIVEFRILVPFTLDQTKIASRYANARRSKEGTKGGDGVEILEKKEIEEDGVKGMYAHRIYHIKSHCPKSLRWALPEKFAHVHEIYKNVFPHYDTHFEIPDMGEDMILKNESRIYEYHKGDKIPENAMNLNEEELKMRKIVYLDLLNESGGKFGDYDCRGVSCPEAQIYEMKSKSKKVNENEIPQWVENYEGNLTLIIKEITFEFKWFGLQTLVEKIVCESIFHDMFVGTHKAMICWANDWYNMDDAAIDAYENAVAEEVNKADFDKNDKEYHGDLSAKGK